jgi:hypothetical protein
VRPVPRGVRPTRLVVSCWSASVLAGGALVALPAHAGAPQGLTPSTLPSYLRLAAGSGSRDIRVNGVYGSGRDGAWQFVAHISWVDRGRQVRGGVVELPAGVGADPSTSPLTTARLISEEHRGWTLDQLAHAIANAAPRQLPLAMLELEIPSQTDGTLTFCTARADLGSCVVVHRTGAAERAADPVRLVSDAAAGPLSVRRV